MGRRNRRRKRQRKREAAEQAKNSSSPAEAFVEARKEAMSNQLGYPTAGSVIRGGSVASRGGSSSTVASRGSTTSAPKKPEFASRNKPQNVVRWAPMAWSKFKWFRDRGDTEIGGFAVSRRDDPLYIVDFLTIKQECSSTNVEFDDEAQAKFMSDMVEKGFHPSEFMRIWLHTHPGNSASPSGTDVSTFRNIFGTCDYSVMIILARGGELTAKLRFNSGPGAEIKLSSEIDLQPPYEGVPADAVETWEAEYQANISKRSYTTYSPRSTSHSSHGYQGRGSYHGGGHYGYPDFDGEWWDRNDNTNGFSQGGASTGGTQSGRSIESRRPRLADQSQIPPYGGVYRLQSREKDAVWQLVNECVENVWQIDENDDETKTVITDLGWYTFGPKAKISADPGDDIDSIHDISDEPPMSSGEVSWRVNENEELEPMKITRILPSGDLIDLRVDDKQAEAEIPMVGGASSSTGTTSDSAAGFAPAASETASDGPKTADERQEALRVWRRCCICHEEIDQGSTYYLEQSGSSTDRAHKDCLPDDNGWILIEGSSSRHKTDIMTKDDVAAANAAATDAATDAGKENDESGFAPATND